MSAEKEFLSIAFCHLSLAIGPIQIFVFAAFSYSHFRLLYFTNTRNSAD